MQRPRTQQARRVRRRVRGQASSQPRRLNRHMFAKVLSIVKIIVKSKTGKTALIQRVLYRESYTESVRKSAVCGKKFCAITSSMCLLLGLPAQMAANVRATHDSSNKYTQFQSVGIGGNLNTSFRQYAQCRACAAPRCKPVTHAHEPPARAPLPFHSSVFIEKEKLSLTNFIPLGTGSYLHCACLLPY